MEMAEVRNMWNRTEHEIWVEPPDHFSGYRGFYPHGHFVRYERAEPADVAQRILDHLAGQDGDIKLKVCYTDVRGLDRYGRPVEETPFSGPGIPPHEFFGEFEEYIDLKSGQGAPQLMRGVNTDNVVISIREKPEGPLSGNTVEVQRIVIGDSYISEVSCW